MSPDEILASSLWPWPDPLLKRDQTGNVLFVNAAFLQLYGGQVQDWFGKPLAGWPAPVSAGAQRFETRIGATPNETVFDWVESVLADGNALAIARNVTVFMAPPAPPAEEITAPQPDPQIQTPALAPEREQIQKAAPAQPAPQPAAPSPVMETPVIETPATPEPVATQTAPTTVQQSAPDLSSEFEDTLNKRADEYAYGDNKTEPAQPQSTNIAPPVAEQISMETPKPAQVAEPVPAQAEQTPVVPPVVAPATPAPQPQENTRMMERRALPIKDSTSVLGSNWRDQVIAKAVGGPAAEENNGADTGQGQDLEDDFEDELPKPGAGLHILLAEDNAINALLTRTLLEAEGAEVDTVEDGALALDAVGKKKYDLIFMDMRMPNMDGLEATRKIRAFGFDRPIIALTANAFDDDRNACFDSGMNDFMTKPVSAEELSEMVVNWTKDEEKQKLAS